jgi:hypothetical protein
MSARGTKNAASRPAADQLTALAGRLTDRDRSLCRLLADHQVLTTDQLAQLLAIPPRTLQQRLTQLTTLKVVDRFRPHAHMGAGSAPYHDLLGEAGAAVLAAEHATGIQGLGWHREQVLALAHANGRLAHLLGVNSLLAALTHAAHTRPQARLVCWWPASRCHARWGRLVRPDAYARWHDPGGEVDFFLHHDPGQPPPDQLTGLLPGYNDLAAATKLTTPVVWWLASPDREAHLRGLLAGQPLLVPVATSNPTCGHPADPVWLPTTSAAGGRRYRLGALGHPHPWQPTPTPPVASAASHPPRAPSPGKPTAGPA